MRAPRVPVVLLALLSLALPVSCGGSGQDRPSVVTTFPTANAVLSGFLGAIRVTYDEPIEILNDSAVEVRALDVEEDFFIPTRLVADPTDATRIYVYPAFGGHFTAGARHRLTVLEGAVVNRHDHYVLDEYEIEFTMGAASNLFLTAADGNVYEADRDTGAPVATTLPPAGFLAREPRGGDGVVYVWLDRIAAGDDELGVFAPGAASITTTIALAGEIGDRVGAHLILDPDGRTLYATAIDSGTNRLLVHRIDVATGTEIAPSIVLSPTLAGSPPVFRPAIDDVRRTLWIAFSDGLGGGALAQIDLDAFAEIDLVPGGGVDAFPVSVGAGDLAFERERDVFYMILEDEATAGIARFDSDDLHERVEREAFVGSPRGIVAPGDARSVLYGLDGYPGVEGVVRVRTQNLSSADVLDLEDDVGGVLQGSTRVVAILQDPATTRAFVVSEGGGASFLTAYDWSEGDVFQTDLDDVTDGVQAIALAAATGGSPVTGIAMLAGAFPGP